MSGRPALPALLRRFAPLGVLVAIALIAWASGLLDVLTPSGFARREALVLNHVHAHPVLALAIYVAIYALLTAALLPVALALSLLGGYLFGTWPAAAALVIAAVISSLITYGAARSAFGATLARRLERGGRMAEIVERIRAETFFYVLSLRFLPIAPFGAVNAAAGIARAPLGAFMAGTLLGIAPTCVIYPGLGAGLRASFGGGHFDPHHVRLRPELIWPLLALAGLSLVTGWLRGRKRAATRL